MRAEIWRSAKAFLAGMILMMVAFKFREQGWQALDAWNISGLAGMIGLFLASLPSLDAR